MILILKMLYFNDHLGGEAKTGKSCYEATTLLFCGLSPTCEFCSEHPQLFQHLADDVDAWIQVHCVPKSY